jgi:aspartate/tyrosine/aromatic aminotransferase
MSEWEYQQAMLERMQELSEALDRAEAGSATAHDWTVIRSECGMFNSGEKQ